MLTISAIGFWGCQKEIEDKSGNSTGGGTSLNTYLPLTSGTFWKLKDSTSGTIQTNTVTSKTKTINGILYTAVTNDQSSDTAYMAQVGADYYLYQAAVTASGGTASVLMHFLNDTAAVGQTWQYDGGSGNGFPIIMTGKIIERGISVTVNGKTYTNVIHTRLHMAYDILGTITDATDYDFYVAKGVGIVQVRTLLDFLGVTIPALNYLVDYNIR